MAYANWLTLSKLAGSGNDTVNATAAANNTGRNARSTNVTFSAAHCADVVRTVMQKGKPETTALQPTAAVQQAGGTVTLTGTSNSKALTFALGNGDLQLSLPAAYTANGAQTANGADISGDPGATAEYNYAIQFSVPANADTSAKSRQVIVTDDAGNQHTCTVTIAAGDAFLNVTPASIELEWDGSDSEYFTVESNTNWTVS